MDLRMTGGAIDIEDSCDSSSDIAKPDNDYTEAGNYDSQVESGSEYQADFGEVGMRNSASSGLTMKEYEEQLKKLTAENFNLKLRVYFVEERLSKVTGISDKEDLIKKNIQLKVTCESQLKELEKKQELLFEASKAFELLQKEHADEVEKLIKEKDKEIADVEEKLSRIEAAYNQVKLKFPNLANINCLDAEFKTFEDYEKQMKDLENNLREEEDRCKELENLLKDSHLELESYQLKTQRLESELDQRLRKIEELVDELEQKEHDLASANFRIRKLEDELKSKQREDEIMKERIEEKNKTIDSLRNSLAARDDTIEVLENRIARERSSSQSLQSKMDSLNFQNSRLKEELEIVQSRLRRTMESSSPRTKGRSVEDDVYKQKYEDLLRLMEDQEAQHNKRLQEFEEKLGVKETEVEDYQELLEKHKKLEDDHRKACTALKNFIKRSGDEKKEREALNRMLNNHEEVIADLKAQLDRYRSNPLTRVTHDDKLSLAETGDNDRKLVCTAEDKESCCYEKDKKVQSILLKLEKEDLVNEMTEKDLINYNCSVEAKLENVSELEAEVVVLKQELENQNTVTSEQKDAVEEVLVNELETKKFEIEKLNGELKRRNINLQEIVNKELWDKNRHIERLEKRLAEVTEVNQAEILALNHKISVRDEQLRVLQNKIESLTVLNKVPLCFSEGELSFEFGKENAAEGISELEFSNRICDDENLLSDGINEGSGENLAINSESEFGHKVMECLQIERAKAKEQADKAEAVKKEAAEVCSLLSLRLEELAEFLDSLLTNRELLSGIGFNKRQDIKQVMEKSRELFKNLSLSFAKRNLSDTSLLWANLKSPCKSALSMSLTDSLANNETLGVLLSRDKVISEQTVIINRLREQLKILNQEIRQRDIELSLCQEDINKSQDEEEERDLTDQGTECKVINNCVETGRGFRSNEAEEAGNDGTREKQRKMDLSVNMEKSCKKSLIFPEENISPILCSHETSESEAWSEPDRSVSLARMGRLGVTSFNASHRTSKREDSSDSSEETLNENPRNSGKRCRSAESEIRKLYSKIKTLDEVNDNLRSEINSLKNGNGDSVFSTRLQKNEEANLAEKLRKTMDRLEECSLTCRQLEEKLALALERASTSTMQLSKAMETISLLEEEINQLKEEIKVKDMEVEVKGRRIKELESKIEEMTIESELKIIEAIKQKEIAEKRTVEVECRLKDAENMSKEVEARVNEIEKKISETKKFKKETVLHYKEAEKHMDTAEKMMEEAERIKLEAERKSKDFQNFIDLMRKEVEEKMKEAERRVKKSEREKEDLENQALKLKKKLLEAEKNKNEVEMKVKEGKDTIQCMEEKLKELEVAMDQSNEEAQKKIKEIQKKADAKVAELEMKIEEREWVRKTETERKMAEAEKISRELEVGFKRQLEEAEKKVKKAKETAELTIKKIQEDAKKQEAELRQRISDMEAEKEVECAELRRQLDEVKLEASEFELELTKLTNEKIHLEEELKRMLEKEFAMIKDSREVKGRYENSIHELENKLMQLSLNKSQLASRLEGIESTNLDLVSRISALRGRETMTVEHEFTSSLSPSLSPHNGSFTSAIFGDVEVSLKEENAEGIEHFIKQGSSASDPGEQLPGIGSLEGFAPPRRNLNSSPDLGIDSDPGRFSSLEIHQQINGDQPAISGSPGASEIKRLEFENAELKRRLVRTRQALEETLTQLSAANQRKKQVEKAICKQLHKTHHILKKARVNFESQDGDYENIE